MHNLISEKVTIDRPIGNLYRKKHVLILVVDKDANFILGKKKGFYPDHIARMLGGKVEEGESPLLAAKREIQEELIVDLPTDAFKELCSVITETSTSKGPMSMQTWIFSARIPDTTNIKPSDDITDIAIYTPEQYKRLITNMESLSGEFMEDGFSFSWSDWGKIYGPIHRYAGEYFSEKE